MYNILINLKTMKKKSTLYTRMCSIHYIGIYKSENVWEKQLKFVLSIKLII